MDKKSEDTRKEPATVTGMVIEALPNINFKVELPDGKVIQAQLSGKMRLHRIRVLVGDTVEMVVDDYGSRARIVRRS